ncbi:hypothetical protein O987_03790 [Comamonas testosteroni TK102]|jgi:hypothetical protein|uniref:Uncharacterized protein n=2 Tax=Comamonas testosteroni TaxID=285 RepID=B7WV48_COMTK|nr:hypothetical protein O987_03790 [Comamonas testosteroni TK102]EED69423.1 hypothetical protein CtesDRAFT_PD4371 [Comamonas testosteroni KF-1]
MFLQALAWIMEPLLLFQELPVLAMYAQTAFFAI